MAEGEDRTEAASPRRLQKAREEGQFPVSREIIMVAAFAASLGVVAVQMHGAMHSAPRWFAAQLAGTHEVGEALPKAWNTVVMAVLPVAAAGFFAAVFAGGVQTGAAFHLPALIPDLGRLSPMRGIKRILGVDTLLTAGRALIKLAALIALGYGTVHGLMLVVMKASTYTPLALLDEVSSRIMGLAWRLMALQIGLSLADLFIVHFRHARSLRMSRAEQRDEHKETEGSPEAKQRLRQMARNRSRRRMMAAVPKATVVVTNPEHYAVALVYQKGGGGAPRVVAKGVDDVAAKIREVAREARVPIVPNPPLARALYRVELDTEIPAEHFKAVAEIIAYIWRLSSRVGVR